jgi:DNA helicase-2/ATP-dependent DNA helicase PcrA
MSDFEYENHSNGFAGYNYQLDNFNQFEPEECNQDGFENGLEIQAKIEEKILGNLNQRQKEAVLSENPSTLVIAGAGSGKTAVLTRRVAYLIANGVVPGQILCLTFTNKAAKEMNNRVRKLLYEVGINLPFLPSWSDNYIQNPLLCTFHALGVKILREYGEYIEIKKNFNILDEDDRKKVINECIRELNLDPKQFSTSLITYFIGLCKQEMLEAENSRRVSKDFLNQFHQIYRLYEQKLRSSQAIDFDDLILLPNLILRKFTEVRTALQNRWHHIMVDEFQDTNPAQFETIKMLSGKI